MMQRFYCAALAALGVLGAASVACAADMPTKVQVAAVPVAPFVATYNWAGFYIGIVGGGASADTRHTNNFNGINSGTKRITGGLLGGTYGLSTQFGSWVLGLEGDFSWSGIKGSFNDNNGSTFCTAPLQCETSLRWFGTDRARLGYAWNNFLVFGTAGVAYGQVRGTINNSSSFRAGDSTRAGIIYGGGVEWAFGPAWSAKAEYLRTDLGDKATYGTAASPKGENVSFKDVNIVRVGLNYRFR